MVTWFALLFAFVLFQRLLELVIARRNGAHIESLGGFEVGKDHYRYIVLLHIAFLCSFLFEVLARHQEGMVPQLAPLTLFVLAQGLRLWVLQTLGKFWNTRIYILPGSEPVTRGPYRFMRHPNYLVVSVELFTLPLCFGAWITAIVFSLLNGVMLAVRIRAEENALIAGTAYAEKMSDRKRFFPLLKK